MNRRDCVTGFAAKSAPRLATLAFVLALAPLPAQAKDQPQHPALAAIQETFKRCQLPAPDELPDRPCMAKTTKTVDALLNRVYGQIIAGLKHSDQQAHPWDDTTLERLIASQRAWVRYRNAECVHYPGPDMFGSIMEYNMWANCEFDMRVDRVNSLFAMYEKRFPEIAGKR